MITLRQPAFYNNPRNNDWCCLSTDSKPVSTTEGYKLYNGDKMYEIDTGKFYKYNAQQDSWELQKSQGGGEAGNNIDITDGVVSAVAELVVKSNAGTQITGTCGDKTITFTTTKDIQTTKIPYLGNWTFVATLEGLSSTRVVDIQYVGKYELDVTFAHIWGVRIDTQNSDPETSLTYTDSAVGMVAGSNDWDNVFPFNMIKPCLFLNGQVNYYLNPNDYTKKFDGTDSDITSGTDGDVMIEFPRCAYSIHYDETGRYLDIKLTDMQAETKDFTLGGEEFTQSPFWDSNNNETRDKLYIGVYHADTNCSSLSGGYPAYNIKYADFITKSHAKGNGYDIFGWYQLIFTQILFLIRYKNLNFNNALGTFDYRGTRQVNGLGNLNGMYYGRKGTAYQPIKFVGIENYGCNYSNCIGGVLRKSNGFAIKTNNFNTDGTGYDLYQLTDNINGLGYISKTVGTNNFGFIPKEYLGSATTYYCSNSNFSENGSYIAWGVSYSATTSQLFNFECSRVITYKSSYISARLMYL